MKKLLLLIIISSILVQISVAQKPIKWKWKRLSTEYAEIELPAKNGKLQSCAEVFDIDNDKRAEIFITESVGTPSVVMYKLTELYKWEKYTIEKRKMNFSEGSAHYDMDNDGDQDLVLADKNENGQIWWWENPGDKLSPRKTWRRHYIIKKGDAGLNDFVFGDFDGNGLMDLAYWNFKTRQLMLATSPEKGKDGEWQTKVIYSYNDDSQMQQNGTGSLISIINYHEGITAADINLDGVTDIVGGGSWFSFNGEGFNQNYIDLGFTNSRVEVGQIIPGGRPEVVMCGGDSQGPLYLYEYIGGIWMKTKVENVNNGHSLQIIDFNQDGNLDIFSAEMISKNTKGARSRIFFGNGKGKFNPIQLSGSYSNHQSKMGDFDGDGDLDVVSKPRSWDIPRIEIWINEGQK